MTRISIAPKTALALLLFLPTAAAAQTGSATGSIDGQSMDLTLDCSNWGDQPYASVVAADKNTLFEGTRFPDGRFALIWKPGDYRYQLMFPDTEATPSLELVNSFNSNKLGRSFEANITVDCSEG